MPPTETLNSEAAKAKAELARQGSLKERSAPASLVQARAAAANNGSSKSSANNSFEAVEATPGSTALAVAAGQGAVAKRKKTVGIAEETRDEEEGSDSGEVKYCISLEARLQYVKQKIAPTIDLLQQCKRALKSFILHAP